jgi:hypothetical protein
MKNIILFLLLVCFSFSGCISVNRYTNKIYPPKDEDEIEVYSISLPTRPYVEIAEIVLEESESVYKLKKEAAKLGTDAIVIIGSAYMNNVCSAWTNWAISTSERSGRKAIAIKYTNQDKTE